MSTIRSCRALQAARVMAFATAMLVAGPARAMPGDCVERLSWVAETEAAGEPSRASEMLAACAALPEARFQMCLVTIEHGSPAAGAACAAALSDVPRWAAEAHLAAGTRALRARDVAAARAHFTAATRLDRTLALARVGLVRAAASPAAARTAARGLAAEPGGLRGPADLLLDDRLRPTAQALGTAIEREAPGCAVCQGRLAYLLALRIQRHPDQLFERRWVPAIAALRKVLAVEPGDLDTRLTLGDTLGLVRDFPGAAQVYEAGLRLQPRWADGALAAGRAWAEAEEPARALPLLESATALAPENPLAWHSLGLTRRRLGRADAVEALRRARRPGDEPTAEARTALGLALLDAGDFAAARAEFERAIVTGEATPTAHFGLARACRGLGDAVAATRAQQAYEQALATQQAQMRTREAKGNHERSVAAALDALAAGRVEDAAREVALVSADGSTAALLPLARAAVALRQRREPGADLDAIVRLCTAGGKP